MALADHLPARPVSLAALIEEHGDELLAVLNDPRHLHTDVARAIESEWGVKVHPQAIGTYRRNCLGVHVGQGRN